MAVMLPANWLILLTVVLSCVNPSPLKAIESCEESGVSISVKPCICVFKAEKSMLCVLKFLKAFVKFSIEAVGKALVITSAKGVSISASFCILGSIFDKSSFGVIFMLSPDVA